MNSETDRKSGDDGKNDLWFVVAVQKMAVQVVHGAVKAVTRGVVNHAESLRIFFNAAKVASHCYGTLIYCLHFPKSMDGLLAVANFFALDLVGETKIPCAFSFDYFTRVNVAIAAPFVLCGTLALVGILWAACVSPDHPTTEGIVSRGLWCVAMFILYLIDFIYPVCTRTPVNHL